MKRFLQILLFFGIFTIFFTSCTEKKALVAESDVTDFNQYVKSQGIYACTDHGWYMIPREQVYYLSPDLTHVPTLLCAKADCDHGSPDTCSSYLTRSSYNLFAWNNMLYYPCMPMGHDGIDLYQMGLDGQDRKVLANLFPGANDYSMITDGGNGYLTVALSEYTVNGDVTTLYLISLADPATEPAVLFSNAEQVEAALGDTSQIPRPYVMHVGEEWVFYNVESGPTGSRSNSLYGYEIATGETKLLVEDTFFIGGDLSPVGDTLYWYDTDYDLTYGRLNQIDLESGEITLIRDIPIQAGESGSLDDRYLYISFGDNVETARLVVYDFQGNEVQTLSCAELGMNLGYAFSSDSVVCFRDFTLRDLMPVCWVDKDKLDEGKAEFHLLPQGE